MNRVICTPYTCDTEILHQTLIKHVEDLGLIIQRK